MLERSMLQFGDPPREAELSLMDDAVGLVVFVHPGGGFRSASRSRDIARRLHHAGLATVVADLVGPDELQGASTPAHDVDALARRVLALTDALPPRAASLPLGLLGADLGGPAALLAAAMRPQQVRAVVCRSDRPDLAGASLPDLRCPTLLVAPAADTAACDANREALAALRCVKRLELVPRATRLYLEAGAIDAFAHAAVAWFEQHLRVPG